MDSAMNPPCVTEIKPTPTTMRSEIIHEAEPNAKDTSTHTHPTVKSSEIPDEDEPKICPLCNAQVRWFFINLAEKILMCENVSCEFPFGYEKLQIAKEADPSVDIRKEMAKSKQNGSRSIQSGITQNTDITYGTRRTQGTSVTQGSVMSAGYTDINKLIRACDPEMSEIDSQFENKALNFAEFMNSCISKKKPDNTEVKIEEQRKKMKELQRKISELHDCKTYIKNEQYLKELMALQASSTKSLLAPQEMSFIKKFETPKTSLNVSVESNEGSIPHIHLSLELEPKP